MPETKNKLQSYTAYKDSGVEWLGEIPEHWKTKKLKFFGSVYPGLNGKKGDDFKKQFSEGFKTFIPFTNICNNTKISEEQYQYVKVNEKEKQNRVRKNDILFLMSSETLDDIAKCSIYLGDKEELYLNSFCKGFRITEDYIFSEYLNYLLASESYRNYFGLVGRGFTRINIKQEFIKSATAPIPPLKEQTVIAKFLDDKTAKIDQAIAIKQQQINLLKERKQILIHKAVTQGLDKNVKLKDSGVEWIGEIPVGWEVTKAKYYSTIFVPERTKPSLNESKEGYPWVTTEHLRSPILIKDSIKYNVNEISKRLAGSRIIKSNSVLATCVGNFGIASKLNFDCIINQQIQGYTDLKVNANYLTYIIRLSEDYFKNNSTLTTIMYVNKDTFGNLPIPLPPHQEQKEISDYIESATEKIATAIGLKEEEIEKLKEYKSSLINGVVTGKVKIV